MSYTAEQEKQITSYRTKDNDYQVKQIFLDNKISEYEWRTAYDYLHDELVWKPNRWYVIKDEEVVKYILQNRR